MKDVYAVIMAAGEGKRMNSNRPKVLHSICGRTLVEWAMHAVGEFCEKPVLIVGHGADQVKGYLGDRAYYVMQEQQLGTGHAVMMARSYLEGKDGYVVIMAGDMPLITQATIRRVVDAMTDEDTEYAAVVLTSRMADPTGYGRIIRRADGTIRQIVEERDASDKEKSIKEVNSSVYCFNIRTLLTFIDKLSNNNAQNEYYLTDCISMMSSKGKKVRALPVIDTSDCMGVNDRVQLSVAARTLQQRIVEQHLRSGVTFIDPQAAYVDCDVTIGRDTIVYPSVVLEGKTAIGEDCILYPSTHIKDSEVGSHVTVKTSYLEACRVAEGVCIGPFAHIRPQSDIAGGCRIGNFVEVKNSVIGTGSKVSHLTYVGDADVGENVNIGCGVVFVNYDGSKKCRSVVEDGCFVGCNSNLISPVHIGSNAYIAAGSTITEDVPAEALAIARERQSNKTNWNKDGMKKK
ncbi:MAG: bifunctional UDP-N-acetylglucosamine diphosphorylase/glucosamine-1-phosphate N-acetyltransferase GlmU [Christensenellales bacterium]|jgi:bifunctional UDP-N-acetylglucosamine pyrophosphorylase/glucosamine-1-phosphate N-acetyltransferase